MATVFRRDGTVNTSQGVGISGANVYICTQPAVTGIIPPSPLASIFADPLGTVPLANPIPTDGLGNYFFYAAIGVYTIVVDDPFARIATEIFPDQQVVSPGGGSVTSVGMTGDGTVLNAVVPGSPIVGSGVLAPTLKVQNAHAVLVGPASGPAAAPTFRTLGASDLPGGLGSVTSIDVAIGGSSLLALSSSGGPITSAGVITLAINFATQPANKVLAGPSSGGLGAVTARSLAAADICGSTPVVFSATPAFDASTFALPTFTITLTGNVTSSSVSNAVAGQTITFVITQDGTGGRTFAWPANFKGASIIGSAASSVTVQSFVYDGTSWRGVSPGLVTAS